MMLFAIFFCKLVFGQLAFKRRVERLSICLHSG